MKTVYSGYIHIRLNDINSWVPKCLHTRSIENGLALEWLCDPEGSPWPPWNSVFFSSEIVR